MNTKQQNDIRQIILSLSSMPIEIFGEIMTELSDDKQEIISAMFFEIGQQNNFSEEEIKNSILKILSHLDIKVDNNANVNVLGQILFDNIKFRKKDIVNYINKLFKHR